VRGRARTVAKKLFALWGGGIDWERKDHGASTGEERSGGRNYIEQGRLIAHPVKGGEVVKGVGRSKASIPRKSRP